MADFSGMDPDAVDASARLLRAKAGRLASLETSIGALVSQMAAQWGGRDAQQFRNAWDQQHRPALRRVHDAIDGLAQSALNNASDQRKTSRAVAGAVAAAYALNSRSTQAGASGSVGIAGASGDSDVTIEQMSDGTYRVKVRGEVGRTAGIGVKDLFKAAGMNVPVDLGVKVSGDGDYEVDFSVADRATAEALERQLVGEASNPVGRVGSVLAPEALMLSAISTGSHMAGVKVEGVTLGVGAGGGAAGEVGLGVDGSADGSVSQTFHPDGGYEVTHSYDMKLNSTGWDTGSETENQQVTMAYDAQGKLQSVHVTDTVNTAVDTRSNAERGVDFVRGIVPFVGHEHSQTDVNSVVTTTSYDASKLSDAQIQDAADGNIRQFMHDASAHRTEIVTENYQGTASSSSQHYGPVATDDGSGQVNLVSRTVKHVGPNGVTIENSPVHPGGGSGGG